MYPRIRVCLINHDELTVRKHLSPLRMRIKIRINPGKIRNRHVNLLPNYLPPILTRIPIVRLCSRIHAKLAEQFVYRKLLICTQCLCRIQNNARASGFSRFRNA